MVDETTIMLPNEETPLGTFEGELALIKSRREGKMPFPEKEVIILGMGITRTFCPFDAEVWSVNMGYIQVAMLKGHLEKIFMAHGQTQDPLGRPLFNWEHFNRLAEEGIEIWNIHRIKGLKTKLFPLKRLIAKYGTDFYTDTICYMIIWAIEKGYKKIRLYGCDMMTQEEYAWEKGGIEYWIGYARAKGIKVEICEGSTLCKTISGKPYGVKYWTLKDIDPTGTLKKKSLPPEPDRPTPWVKM